MKPVQAIEPLPECEGDKGSPAFMMEALMAYCEGNEVLNRRIEAALNAGHRMKLLEEKNRLIEAFERQCGMSQARPDPLPDYPVFDVRGMEDLIARERELERQAQMEPPRFLLRSWYGLTLAVMILFAVSAVVGVQIRSYVQDVQPVTEAQDEQLVQIEQLLAEIGDDHSIRAATSLDDLNQRMAKLSQAVAVMSQSAKVDRDLQERVSEAQIRLVDQVAKLRKAREKQRL